MPPIFRLACTRCDFELPRGSGGFLAVLLQDSRREVLSHPVEFGAAQRLTGKPLDVLDSEGRLRFIAQYLCLSCLALVALDGERDAIVCAHCGGGDLKPTLRLAGETCPSCGRGTIERVMVGFS